MEKRGMVKRFWGRVLFGEFHRSFLVVFLCIGVVAGVVLGVVLRVNYFGSPVWLLVIAVLFVFGYLKPKYVFSVAMLVMGMVGAFYRIATELAGENYIRGFWGMEIVVAGKIKGDPDESSGDTKVKLTELSFDEEYETSGTIYLTLRENQDLRRGDIVVVRGKIDEGFGVYAGYMYRPEVLKISKPDPPNMILAVRDWFSERVRKVIPDPQVNLGLSYLLGMKTGLPEELSEDLRIVGLTHIVVASGAHLSILVGLSKKIFGKVSRFAGALFSGLFVVFFMAMVGFTPSILRAGIMSLISILVGYVGRKMEPWRIILVVAAITLLIDPMFVMDVGWLLSFASFFGIMILGPRIVKFFYGERKPGFVASTIITTAAATIMTLPIAIYYFGAFSLISVAANLLILPTLPYAMGAVFLAGVVSGVPGLNGVVGFLATKLLDFHILVVGIFSEMQSFLVELEPYSGAVFLIYVVIFTTLAGGLLWKKMIKYREEKY